MKLDKRESYRGSYKGVDFEICSFTSEAIPQIDIPEKKNWTFYLILQLDRIPPENNPDNYWLIPEKIEIVPGSGRFMNNYREYDSPLGTLDWHGGITWYSKESNEDSYQRVIKAGCDYQHYGDEGRSYDIDYIIHDVKNCIDSFREKVPGYKYHCSMVGGYWDISEGELNENGGFISNKGKQYRIDQGWDKSETDN